MNLAEQIKALEATRAAKAARMEAVMQKAADEGRSSDAAESEEFDTLEGEIQQLDADLTRYKRLEALAVQKGTRVVVPAIDKQHEAAPQRGPTIIVAPKDVEPKFKGQMYTRLVIAKALAHILQVPAYVVAQRRWGKTNPTLVELIKANVAGGGSDSGEWGAELVSADNRYTADFIEFLYAATVFDKLALREVPANITIKGQDGQGTGYWVGQSKAIPATALDFSAVSLTSLKVAALAVISNELIRESSPAAEQLVRDALVQASAQRVDSTFLSATAASAGVSPAGLLNGVSATASSGNEGDDVRADIKALYDIFIAAKNATGLSFVMNPSLAKALQLMTNALGQKEFPNIRQTGGDLEGDPVVTGDNVNSAHLILLKPSDIWKIGDLGIEVSVSREATIEQNDAPAGASDTPVDMAAPRVSMFQEESTAIKVVRPINFAKRRTSAVQYVNNAAYGQSTG